MFISQITQNDIDRSSTLENDDLNKYAIYCNGSILVLCESYDEAKKMLRYDI
tara:strand:- start:176 stop:331 length:156 start_codon:yes stop_codon:yes gene_type:complete